MPKTKTYDIIKTEDARVSIFQGNHFTIGTSPYYAHQHGLAIDIYQNLSLDNYDAISPVSGKVIKTKKLIAPRAKFKGGIDNDYIIIIQNSDTSDVVYKILHVKPKVQVGDQLEIGDYIGTTIRNGYFAYWSSPHLHLEIRPRDDAIRARGGKDFSLNIEKNKKLEKSSSKNQFKEIPLEIHSVYPEFLLAKLPTKYYHLIKPFYGIKGNTGNMNCILDGGIPHYKYGTIISQHESIMDSFNSVYFGQHEIGSLQEVRGNFGFINFNHVKFLLDNKEIRGISLFLANFPPLIKLIPYNKDEISINSETTQYLSILLNGRHEQ